jgi:hypothetical protein
MFGTDMLTLQEFIMQERLPLATIQNAVLHFLRNRDDVVVFGAQAVNAYVGEPRMTQDIDLLSPRAEELAEELRAYLSQQFHIAVRIRIVGEGGGYRLYQVQKAGNRHLVDLRTIKKLPMAHRIEQVLIMAPAELIASKVISYYRRRGKPKAGTDWRDLAMLLLKFPELKSNSGVVADGLVASGAGPAILAVWQEIVATEIKPEDDEDEFWRTED